MADLSESLSAFTFLFQRNWKHFSADLSEFVCFCFSISVQQNAGGSAASLDDANAKDETGELEEGELKETEETGDDREEGGAGTEEGGGDEQPQIGAETEEGGADEREQGGAETGGGDETQLGVAEIVAEIVGNDDDDENDDDDAEPPNVEREEENDDDDEDDDDDAEPPSVAKNTRLSRSRVAKLVQEGLARSQANQNKKKQKRQKQPRKPRRKPIPKRGKNLAARDNAELDKNENEESNGDDDDEPSAQNEVPPPEEDSESIQVFGERRPGITHTNPCRYEYVPDFSRAQLKTVNEPEISQKF